MTDHNRISPQSRPSWENLTAVIRPMIESVCSDGNSDAARLAKDIADAILRGEYSELPPLGDSRRDRIPAAEVPPKSVMVHFTDDQIKHIVDRFLGWRVPSDFNPDAGIAYTPARQLPGIDRRPYGTNLLDAQQAEAMVRYIVDGLRAAPTHSPAGSARLAPHESAELTADARTKAGAGLAMEVIDKAQEVMALKEENKRLGDLVEELKLSLSSLWVCDGCGTRKSLEQIKGEHPLAIACCPERKMRPPGTECPNCHNANKYGDYEGPTCDVCLGVGFVGDTPAFPSTERK